MRRALDLARQAARSGEVPVGAVITRGDTIIAEAANAMRGTNDPTAHAEMVAIRAAAAAIASPRLDGCTLWVTLEPCPMCAAASGLSRLQRLVFAADDPKGGGVVHGARIFAQPTCHHRPEIITGLGEAEASAMLRDFFAARRT